jgi:hypothetical protein
MGRVRDARALTQPIVERGGRQSEHARITLYVAVNVGDGKRGARGPGVLCVAAAGTVAAGGTWSVAPRGSDAAECYHFGSLQLNLKSLQFCLCRRSQKSEPSTFPMQSIRVLLRF